MTRHPFRATTAALAATVLCLSLSACAPPRSSTPEAEPTRSPSASATPTPEAPTGPEPRIGVACPDIATAASVSTLLTSAVAVADPARTAIAAYPGMPPLFFVRTLGGLVCEWSNGEPESATIGHAPAYVGARLSILPEADAQWTRFADLYGVTGGRTTNCFFMDTVQCNLDALVNGSWIEARLQGMAVAESAGVAAWEAAAAPFFDPIVAAVAAAGPPGPRWVPPAGTLSIPADCDSFVTPGDVTAALGVADALYSATPGDGWGQAAGAIEDAAGFGCHWRNDFHDGGLGGLNWLPGGAWAAAEARAAAVTPWTADDVALAGLAADDSAYIRCLPGDESCLVDMVVGGNWIQVDIWRDESSPPISVSRRIGAVAIAEAIVARLRP